MAYRGNKAEVPLGEYGLLTDVSPDKSPIAALIRSSNITYTNGVVQKAPGSVKWNAVSVGAPIVAAHAWAPSTVVQRMIAVTQNGQIFKGQDRQFGTAINTDLGMLNPNCVFAEGGNEVANALKKLFLFTAGATLPLVLRGDGPSFSAISGPSPDWVPTNRPKAGVIHRNRLWAFAGQIAYASDSGNHENFTSNNRVDPVYPGEGGEIRGAFVYKGRMFVFKDGGFVYLFNDESEDEEAWYFQKIASNFGLAAPNAIAEVLNNLYAGNTTGTITDYAATDAFGSVEASDLIQAALFENHLRGNTSKVGVPEQHLYYYAEKKQLFATYRSGYYTQNDMLIMLDFGRGQQIRASYWKKGSPMCLASYKDVNQIERPMYGDGAGFLHLMDAEDRTEGGAAYLAEFQLPHMDFNALGPGMRSANKHFDHLAVHYIPEGTGNLMCDYFIDGKYVDTISFVMVQNKKPLLGRFLLSTDRLAQPNTETCVRRIAGSGRTFSARFYNSGSNESFQVSAVTVYFRGGGDKAQQEGKD